MAEENCIHIWMIATPNGPTSPGRCRLCGEVKDFKNSFPERGRWAKDRGMNRKGRGTDAMNEKAAKRQIGATMR